MKKRERAPLSVRERNGMIALLIIIILIMVAALLMRNCRGSQPGQPGTIVLCDTLPAETYSTFGNKHEHRDRKEKADSLRNSKRKAHGNKSKTGSSKRKEKNAKSSPEIVPRHHLKEDLAE